MTSNEPLEHPDKQQLLTWDNAFAERFVRSIREECLNRMIFFGEGSLRHALAQYMTHYHRERYHQGAGNQLLQNSGTVACVGGAVRRRCRLGGMLSFYHREAGPFMYRAP